MLYRLLYRYYDLSSNRCAMENRRRSSTFSFREEAVFSDNFPERKGIFI